MVRFTGAAFDTLTVFGFLRTGGRLTTGVLAVSQIRALILLTNDRASRVGTLTS